MGWFFAGGGLPVAGAVLWLKADSITGLNDGDPISTWSDLSGSAKDGTAATTKRPTYKTNIQNSLPAVRFDGGDRLDLAGGAWPDSPFTIFAVYKSTNAADHQTIVGLGSSSAGFSDAYMTGLSILSDKGQVGDKYNDPTDGLTSAATLSNQNKFNVVTGVATGSGYKFRINGGVVSESNANGASANLYTKSCIGATDGSNSDAVINPFYGDILEIVAYNSSLSDDDIALVESYLAKRWMVCGASHSLGLKLVAQDLVGTYADNDPVSTWTDASGSSRNATSSGGNRPILKTSIINSRAVVRFQGTDDRMDLPVETFPVPDFTIFCVCAVTGTNADQKIFGLSSSSGGFMEYNTGLVVHANKAVVAAKIGVAGPQATSTTTINNTSTFYLWTGTAKMGGRGFSIRINGAEEGTSSTAFELSGYTKCTLGAGDGSDSGATTEPFTGDIAELRVYTRELSSSEISTIESELNATYSIY
jgi:hypothetical protein